MCEPTLWTHWTHCGSAQAQVPTRLLTLDADVFHKAVITFPTDHVLNYAGQFVDLLNDQDQEGLTDLLTLDEDLDDLIHCVFEGSRRDLHALIPETPNSMANHHRHHHHGASNHHTEEDGGRFQL